MKICFLSSTHSPHDKRVFEKEAVSLAKAGFRVVHLAPGDGTTTCEEDVELVTFQRQPGLRGRLLLLPCLYRRAVQIAADCYHCNEVDSWLIGVFLKIFRKKKIVFDVHEHYPSVFAERRFPDKLQPMAANFVRAFFRLLLPFTDKLVFAKQSVEVDFRGSEHKQVVVRNFTPLSALDNSALSLTEKHNTPADGVVTAIHLGAINRRRGWPQLIEAMALMKSTNLRLHIVGSFHDGSRPEFEARVKQLDLQDRVLIEEWMPFDQAFERLTRADIGLVVFQPNIQNHVYAFPHKLFDYMLAKLAVIIPNFAEEIVPLIQGAGCGLLVDSSSPKSIASALDYLVEHPLERKRLGENGYRMVLEAYNWEAEVQKLIQMYVEISAAFNTDSV